MKEDKVGMPDTTNLTQALQPWRQALFERVVRITAVVAAPALLVGVYYLYSTHITWMIPLAVLAYAVVLAGVLLPQIDYAWRVWAFVGAVVALGIADLVGYGWGEDARIYLMSAVLFATIFLGRRHGLVALVLACVILAAYVFAVGFELVPAHSVNAEYSFSTLVTSLAIFVVLAAALYSSFNYLFPRLFNALQESTQLSQKLDAEREALAARTNALQEANLNLQRRAIYFDASAQVSRALTTIFEIEPLLQQAVTAIHYHFELEYVGVYLMDDAERWFKLHAASSGGGRDMVAQGYRVERGSTSFVAQAAEMRETQVANADSLADFATAALPDARSATALPLVAAGELIGVLEMQSTEEAAFDQDNVRALEVMAGQLAVAIANARRSSVNAVDAEARSPSYRLAWRLAVAGSEMDVCTVVLDTVNGFGPAHAFVVQMPRGAEAVNFFAELREGHVEAQEAADLQIVSAGALRAASEGLEAPWVLSDLTAPPAGLSSGIERLREQLVAQSDIRSVALIPLRTESDLFSALLVAYLTEHDFTPLETQLYRTIQDLGGAALARAQMVQDAEVRVERERWLREFGERVMRMPDLNAMMVQAAESLQDAVQADGVVVSIALPGSTPVQPGDEVV